MIKAPYDSHYTPRTKKVKHVHFIENLELLCLERNVNEFADKHPEYKILGIKLTTLSFVSDVLYIAAITYLCDAPGEFDSYNDYSDDEEEE